MSLRIMDYESMHPFDKIDIMLNKYNSQKNYVGYKKHNVWDIGYAYLYIINACGTGFYKIGISSNPNKRLKTLQTASPHSLKIIDKFKYRRDKAYKLEQYLHKYFKSIKCKGGKEWFNINNEILSNIKCIIDNFKERS